jgi:hypothetical protein
MIDRDTFFDVVRDSPFHKSLNQGQVDGINAILDTWESSGKGQDTRWVAYSLATAYHETMATMQPVRELGKGRGKPYGKPAGPYGLIYYGRGEIQDTWYANYVKTDKELKALGVLTPDQDLVKNPDLMLDLKISCAALVYGMINGWYTGHKLSDYFAGSRSDWVDARMIVNRMDKAKLIASYGLAFEHALDGGK